MTHLSLDAYAVLHVPLSTEITQKMNKTIKLKEVHGMATKTIKTTGRASMLNVTE